jgi:hypothetical protein
LGPARHSRHPAARGDPAAAGEKFERAGGGSTWARLPLLMPKAAVYRSLDIGIVQPNDAKRL